MNAKLNDIAEPRRPERSPLLRILEKRIHNLVDDVIPEVSNDNRVTEALELNDKDLMKAFLISFLESKSGLNDREKRKLEKRISSTVSFYEKLGDVGGYIKAKDVADILSVSRQTVNKKVKGNKILAFRKGGDYVFPYFQFEDLDLLPEYEEVMQLMPEDVDSYLRFSFFVNKIDGSSGVSKTPIEIIKVGSKEEKEFMKRRACLFGRHMAK